MTRAESNYRKSKPLRQNHVFTDSYLKQKRRWSEIADTPDKDVTFSFLLSLPLEYEVYFFMPNIGKKEFERDRIQSKLEILIRNYQTLRDLFLSDSAKINLIMNDDRLSFSEAIRIRQKLNDIGIHLHRVVINKAQNKKIPEEISIEFKNQKINMFPYSSKHLLGLHTITEYIDANKEIFTTVLNC